MKPFTRVSASQITLFRRCPRRWWTEHVLGRRSPSTANQELGTRIHSEIERYLLGGPLPEYESARRLMLDPGAPKPGGLVEWPADYELGLKIETEHGWVNVRGRIDYVVPPISFLVEIFDWKSTSGFQWAKTGAELEHDVQFIIYAQAMFQKYPEARSADFTHGYVLTKGTGHRLVATSMVSREEIAFRYEGIVETVRHMARVALLPIEQVPQNFNACGDYGGCPFRVECGVIRNQTFDAMFSAESTPTQSKEPSSMSLAEKLKNRPKGPPAPAATATPAPSILPPDAAKPVEVKPYVPPVTIAELVRVCEAPKSVAEVLPHGLGGAAKALLESQGITERLVSIEFGPETLKRIDRYLDLFSSGR